MRLSDAYLARFEALHPKKIDLTLGRVERLLATLDNPQNALPPVIHVAGTNGKGSTIAFLRAMLEASGAKVHVFTSPHLVRFHERIRIGAAGGGKLVSEEALVAAFERVEAANAGEPITFFEITAIVAIDLFRRNPADVVLMEVGLGGRFDATNVFSRPAASVITPISIDHREFLGDTIEKIAYEKAGIIKKNVPLILAQQNEAAIGVCTLEAAALRAPVLIGGQDFQAYEENGRLIYQDESGLLDLPLPRLKGRHQHVNAATAIATLRKIMPERATQAALEGGLLQAQWPARLQRLTGALAKSLPEGAELWLDGGHNQDGARVLAEALAEFEEKNPRPLILLAGMMARKDAHEILAAFEGQVQEFYALPIDNPLARPAAELAQIARNQGFMAAQAGSVQETLAFLGAREWSSPPRIVITGSLYLAGEVLEADGSVLT